MKRCFCGVSVVWRMVEAGGRASERATGPLSWFLPAGSRYHETRSNMHALIHTYIHTCAYTRILGHIYRVLKRQLMPMPYMVLVLKTSPNNSRQYCVWNAPYTAVETGEDATDIIAKLRVSKGPR